MFSSAPSHATHYCHECCSYVQAQLQHQTVLEDEEGEYACHQCTSTFVETVSPTSTDDLMSFMSPPLLSSNLPYYPDTASSNNNSNSNNNNNSGHSEAEENDWLSFPAQVHFLPTTDGTPVLSVESSPLQATMLLASMMRSLQTEENEENEEGGEEREGGSGGRRTRANVMSNLADLSILATLLQHQTRTPHQTQTAIPNTLGDYTLSDDLSPILNALFQNSPAASSKPSVEKEVWSLLPRFDPMLYETALRDLECAITQAPLHESETGVCVLLPCLHAFHETAIEQWLHQNNTCPVCRIPISIEEVQEKEEAMAQYLEEHKD